MNAYICTALSFDLDIVFSSVLVLYHANEQPWERPGNERREREREKIDEEITRIKKYFNVAIKINFVCCILIWCTLCLVSFSKQWNTRKKELEEREFVWFGGVFTVCHLELRRMKAPNQPKVTVHNEMCSDSWRFLKCDNGTSQVHGNWTKRRAHTPHSQCKQQKTERNSNPKMLCCGVRWLDFYLPLLRIEWWCSFGQVPSYRLRLCVILFHTS